MLTTTLEMLEIDRQIAESLTCPRCGKRCRYEAEWEETLQGGVTNYTALAVCECGYRKAF